MARWEMNWTKRHCYLFTYPLRDLWDRTKHRCRMDRMATLRGSQPATVKKVEALFDGGYRTKRVPQLVRHGIASIEGHREVGRDWHRISFFKSRSALEHRPKLESGRDEHHRHEFKWLQTFLDLVQPRTSHKFRETLVEVGGATCEVWSEAIRRRIRPIRPPCMIVRPKFRLDSICKLKVWVSLEIFA